MATIPLRQYAKHTTDSSHHLAFWDALEQHLTAAQRALYAPGGELRDIWQAQSAEAAPPPAPAAPPAASRVRLAVPYEFQNDNASGNGCDECFSSSCAMVARYYGMVRNDDEYNRIRAKFGDSTSSDVQLKALHHLGLVAVFRTNGTLADLERLIRNGQPVPVGWLHKGPVTAPYGGGHWSVVIGFDDASFIHNDPNGEANMISGGYVSTSGTAGRGIAYSRKNWSRRWLVDGNASGWFFDIKKA